MNTRIYLSLLATLLFACSSVDESDISATTSRVAKGYVPSNIVLQEYADLQCPACKTAHEKVITPIMEKYGAVIRYEYNHFPLRQIHRYALPAAIAAECAADKGKFWEFIDHVYKNQDTLNSARLPAFLEAVGVPNDDYIERCLQSDKKREIVLADYEKGVALDVQGTPTIFLNGVKVTATYEAISTAIEAEIAKIGL